jgi:plastocyanin
MSNRLMKGLLFQLTLGAVVVSLTGIAYTSGLSTVRIEDRCDPATFNAVVGDGTCVADLGTTFDEFIAELAATQSVEHWRFKEDEFHIRAGEAVNAFNIGGEVHSFTHVQNFGGGVVGVLNDLSGAGAITPECAAGFVPVFPGTSSAPQVLTTTGVHRFQCCIHPWMRSEVTVRNR